MRTWASEGFPPLGQLVPRETTNMTLKALHGFEDSETLTETKKVNRRDRGKKKQKGHRRMICDLQTKKNAGAKELIPVPALEWTDIWSP